MTGCTSFSSNNFYNLISVIHITVDESFAYSSLQNWFNSDKLVGFWVLPQHLYWVQVRTLTLASPNFCFVSFQLFRCGLAFVFWIIVLVHNPIALQIQLTDRWLDILLKIFHVQSRINGSFNNGKWSRSQESKAMTVGMMFFTWNAAFSLCQI